MLCARPLQILQISLNIGSLAAFFPVSRYFLIISTTHYGLIAARPTIS